MSPNDDPQPPPPGEGIWRWLDRQIGHVRDALEPDVTAPTPKTIYRDTKVEEQPLRDDPRVKLRRTVIDEVVVDENHPKEVKARLFRVILPVSDIELAKRFYSQVLGIPGHRVSLGRHYFNCGGTILACYDPRADGDKKDAAPNPDHIYIAVNDLEAAYDRAKSANGQWFEEKIQTRPWGERSFYAKDPFGNPICFVDEKTVFTGE